ncbi:hypothetical protein [Azospirillum largimobile]
MRGSGLGGMGSAWDPGRRRLGAAGAATRSRRVGSGWRLDDRAPGRPENGRTGAGRQPPGPAQEQSVGSADVGVGGRGAKTPWS